LRLLIRIVSSVLLGIIALLAIDGYLSVRREIDLFDSDMARDGILLGRTLKPVIAETWRTEGEEAALEAIREIRQQTQRVQLRWVWLDAPPDDPFAPRASRENLDALKDAQEISFKQVTRRQKGYRYTYILVPVESGRRGALELSESLSELDAYTHNTILRKILLAGLMTFVSWIVLWILGIRYVGSPLNQLVEKTKRIGAGDFSGEVVLHGKDELANLANAMNEMCAQLAAARDALLKETEARIIALEQLRHADRLATVGRLASGIAHELGTPLNVVSGRARLIATEELDRDDVVAFSNTIVEQARRMTEIIRQILDFARRRHPRREPVDVLQLTNQALDLLQPTARKSGVSLDVAKTTDIPMLVVDRSQIQQVLTNLIMNGIQAMPEGGTLLVELGVERARRPSKITEAESDYLVMRVIDQGHGIPEDRTDLIFDAFYTTKDAGEGTGLGLSITHGIVEEHNGWIGVDSEPGKGTRFTVYLPTEDQP
jgi:two-component system NtrC family sensor kinase